MRILRGVEPFLMAFSSEPDATIENAIAQLTRLSRVEPGDKLIIATDIIAQDRAVDGVMLRTIR
jgi:pyruvate kinase